ncbi:MAG: glycosyltransferase [Planctomycetes bacterium]|nr:glycosyltransferase [Planctomycetota bacterium]
MSPPAATPTRRVLILNYEYPPLGGGAGRAAALLARELARMGHDVRVLTGRASGLPALDQDGRVQVERVFCLRRRRDRAGVLQMLAWCLLGAVAAWRMARRWRPDAAVAFFGVPGGPVAWVLRRFLGIPYLVSLRGGDVPGFPLAETSHGLLQRLAAPVVRAVWRSSAGVVANSDHLADLARRAEPGLAVRVIPNAVDAVPERRVVDRAGGGLRLVYAGRLAPHKDLPTLLVAVAGLRRRGVEVRLDVVGDGPCRGSLERAAAELGIADRVHFLGWRTREEVGLALGRSDVFVLPSLSEGMPNALLEAMAQGLAVVSSSAGGCPEVVEDGVEGILFPPGDAATLARRLDLLHRRPALRAALGERARASTRRFGPREVARRYLRELERAIEGRPAPEAMPRAAPASPRLRPVERSVS